MGEVVASVGKMPLKHEGVMLTTYTLYELSDNIRAILNDAYSCAHPDMMCTVDSAKRLCIVMVPVLYTECADMHLQRPINLAEAGSDLVWQLYGCGMSCSGCCLCANEAVCCKSSCCCRGHHCCCFCCSWPCKHGISC